MALIGPIIRSEDRKSATRQGKMKLYLLKAIIPASYDEYNGFVVRAEDEDRAREVGGGPAGGYLAPLYWTCEVITTRGRRGIILEDFHAG